MLPYPNHLGHYIHDAYPYYLELSLGDEIVINTEICLNEKIDPERAREDYLYNDSLNRSNFSIRSLMHALIYKHGYVGEIVEEQDQVPERGKNPEVVWREELKAKPPTIKYNKLLEQELFNTTIGRKETVIGVGEEEEGTRRLELLGNARLGEEEWQLYRIAEIRRGEIISGALLILDFKGLKGSAEELKKFLNQDLSPDSLKRLQDRKITNELYFLGRPMMCEDHQIRFPELTQRQKEIIEAQKRIEDGREI
jgi:hypothetical protein